MIKIVAKSFIKADKVEQYIALAKKLVQETVQNDTGCICYEFASGLVKSADTDHNRGMGRP